MINNGWEWVDANSAYGAKIDEDKVFMEKLPVLDVDPIRQSIIESSHRQLRILEDMQRHRASMRKGLYYEMLQNPWLAP